VLVAMMTCSPYGIGKRIDLKNTRNIIHRILDGSVKSAPSAEHSVFKLKYPTKIEGVDTDILSPRTCWPSAAKYDEAAAQLAKLFIKNYEPFKQGAKVDYSKFGPSL
jgi:phosphoenolpyruvate carboxykinase (ATP)